jgi:hypothetical protein
VLPNRVHEERGYLVTLFLGLLQEGVGVGVEAMLVGGLAGESVGVEHIQHKKVYHCLFPSDRLVWVDQIDPVKPVILHLPHRTLVREESLPGNVLRRIDLQVDEIDSFHRVLVDGVDHGFFDLLVLGHSHQSNLVDQVDVALIGSGEGFKGGRAGSLCADGFPLIEEVVFGGDCAEEEAVAMHQSHSIIVRNGFNFKFGQKAIDTTGIHQRCLTRQLQGARRRSRS